MHALFKSSFGKIYVRDLLARSQQTSICLYNLFNEISAQALNNSSLDPIYVRDPLARSLQQILCNVSVQHLSKRCPGKISVQHLYKRGLLARSLKGDAWQDTSRSLCNVSVQDLFPKSLHKLSIIVLLARPM